MHLLAQAVLSRIQGPNERITTVRVVALDHPGDDASDRHVVTLQTAHLEQGVSQRVDDSTLTPLPVSLAQARQRAQDYIRQRLNMGEVLQSHHGLELPELPVRAMAASTVAVAEPALAESRIQKAAIPVLCDKLQATSWRRLSGDQRSRVVWRLAEYADPARGGNAQQQLYRQVPRLIELLGSGEDLLDYCLAYLIGRLGDGGAAVAMQALSQRARSEATRDLARQAWLALISSEDRDQALQPQRDAMAAEPTLDGRGLLVLDELASHDPSLASTLHDSLGSVPLTRAWWPALRRIYKRAEWRHDHATLAVLHARFDGQKPHGRDMSRDTFMYMRLRGWRYMRRLAGVGQSQAAPLAAAMLRQFDLACSRRDDDSGRHTEEKQWLLASKLLLPRWPGLRTYAGGLRWSTFDALDLTQLPATRVDGLPEMWDEQPQWLLPLVSQGRTPLLLWSLTRALRDQTALLDSLDVTAAMPLLHHPYAPAATLGLEIAQQRMESLRDPALLRPWLLALAQCPDGPAAEYLAQWLSRHRVAAAGDAELVASLLISAADVLRTHGVALLAYADGAAVALALLAALPTLSENHPALQQVADGIQSLLAPGAPLARNAASVPAAPLHHLLSHSLTPLVEIATGWLLVHPEGLRSLPPASLRELLASDEPARVACGVRLMASLSDDVLSAQGDVLAEFAISPHAGLREAVAPLIRRLAHDSRCNTLMAERLHDALFRAEPADGVHSAALALLTGPLAHVAPARDASGTWRALQARATGAQRYGAWALAALDKDAFSLRQWATLARHADTDVRARSRQSIDARLVPLSHTTAEQAAQLLPLADARFADTQQYARELLGERLPDSALEPELLVSWVDHPQSWVQALGRQRLMQRMSAPEASLCLTRLAQHPSTSVQLFVTQWLLNLPEESAPERAARLAGLQPYFLAVLSQVHRARASKTRVLHFLRAQVEAPETAAVVAGIFARQVVSASLMDQPDYVAGLRDIMARHPGLAQSFMQAVPAERRTSTSTGRNSNNDGHPERARV